jgi:hypothetical protein
MTVFRSLGCLSALLGVVACGSEQGPEERLAAIEAEERAALPADPELVARHERKFEILGRALAESAAPIAYHPSELAAVRKVVALAGELYAGPTSGEEFRLQRQPWSGYWYPLGSTALFEGDEAPLAKLDRLAQAKGRPDGSAQWERDHHEELPEAAWEGLCGAWSVASTRTLEPLRPVTMNGVSFSIADQKALLIKAHESFPTRTVGVRYNGDFETDGTYQDLRPEAFHRLAEYHLRERGLPLVVDTDAGPAVWNKPLFRFRWIARQDPERDDALLVEAFPWFVKQREEVDDALTTELDVVAATYTYRLYVDKRTVMNGKYRVLAGEWLGDSLGYHPDFALLPQSSGSWASANPALTANFDLVKELLDRGTRLLDP